MDQNPPDISSWVEYPNLRHIEYIKKKILVFDCRFYRNPDFPYYLQAADTYNFFSKGIALLLLMVRMDKEDEGCVTHFLLLEDGSWARGKPNTGYKSEVTNEQKGGINLLKITISLDTDSGIKSRTFIGKV